jgi:DNA-binding CsgD family transcriptional regulator
VKKGRGFSKGSLQEKKQDAARSSGAQHYMFWDQAAGIMQFQADCEADLNCTIERMAGLLAMQCLLGGHEPSDFSVLVPVEQTFQERLWVRAQSLLEEGRSASAPNSLSPRQKENLHSVVRNHANKEIASRLNITVRTVKFHISALLSKFGVQNRSELARRASRLIREVVASEPAERPSLVPPAGKNEEIAEGGSYPLPVTIKGRQVRYSGRMLTA